MTKSFTYSPSSNPREHLPYYIGANQTEISEMIKTVGIKDLEDLFSHIPSSLRYQNEEHENLPHLSLNEIAKDVENIAKKNNVFSSFIGDGLKSYKVQPIVSHVCGLRGLVTAYTPYQPERCQGTLNSLWMYSSLISQLTGFEAINASMYERSTCLFEAAKTSQRIQKSKNKVLVSKGLFPRDLEVLKTLSEGTDLEFLTYPLDEETGLTNLRELKRLISENKEDLASVIFCQSNHFGNLENVHELVDLCKNHDLLSIAVIDPMLLATQGLCPPSQYGSEKLGADIIVAEGQHLAIGPTFGGPGLGILGVRYHQNQKAHIRSTPGRFVGKTIDVNNKRALAMVLSTREQHIRREKATSNICSNQSFIATLVGAAILNRGEKGMTEAIFKARENCLFFLEKIKNLSEISLAFPTSPFYNEVTLELKKGTTSSLIQKARKEKIHIGIDVGLRSEKKRELLLISFFDTHSEKDLEALINFFTREFEKSGPLGDYTKIPHNYLREDQANLPSFEFHEICNFYDQLNRQNIGVDEGIYPLGSCTMKYNPYINEYTSNLPAFTQVHPQAPIEDVQGCLEILFNIQEMFKSITGLPAVTTEPVAGAQGELVGLKVFQAYHKFHGEDAQRKIILIPESAHGTNPATAAVAGILNKKNNGEIEGILTIKANEDGQIDFDHLKDLVTTHGKRIIGVMITNPNTSGIFETKFKEISDLIHSVGGLVYMDGANMNAIACQIDLNKMGVDAVHNNLHKTWSIPHGGGGPGDAIVAVSEKLKDFLPGYQIIKTKEGSYDVQLPSHSIGFMHRHWGNFAHKVRCYTYIKALGTEGIQQMSGVAVLCSRYLQHHIEKSFSILPAGTEKTARMHEFIITLSPEEFSKLADAGIPKAQVMSKTGKLFLDLGYHAPTVAFPEVYGLMIEPTESFSKKELDNFIKTIQEMRMIIHDYPQIIFSAPHFTPVRKIDEVTANKNLILSEKITELYEIPQDIASPEKLKEMNLNDRVKLCQQITEKQ